MWEANRGLSKWQSSFSSAALTCTRMCLGRRGAREDTGRPTAGRGYLTWFRWLCRGSPPRGRGNSWWWSWSAAASPRGPRLERKENKLRVQNTGEVVLMTPMGEWIFTSLIMKIKLPLCSARWFIESKVPNPLKVLLALMMICRMMPARSDVRKLFPSTWKFLCA